MTKKIPNVDGRYIERADLIQALLVSTEKAEKEKAEKEKAETAYCTYPDCNCPFDAPADPNWCARSLPHKDS